jgi:hypothetical protein
MWFCIVRIYTNLPVPLALGMTLSRHWRCMNLHLCLTYPQLILHHFVTELCRWCDSALLSQCSSPWCDPFWTRHCRCMNIHLCLTLPADPPLPALHEPPSATGHWCDSSLTRHHCYVIISRLATGDLPFLNPADTIVPYMACMIPLLNLSYPTSR